MRNAERLTKKIVSFGIKSVADLGCGDGELITKLLAQGVDAVGIESDPGKVQKLKMEGIPVILGTAESSTLRDKSVDLIVMSRVLHHLHRPELALRESLRIAREAVLILESNFPIGYDLERASDWLSKAIHRASGHFHHDPFDSLTLEAIAGSLGAEVIETSVWEPENGDFGQPLPDVWQYHMRFLDKLDAKDPLRKMATEFVERHKEKILRDAFDLIVKIAPNRELDFTNKKGLRNNVQ